VARGAKPRIQRRCIAYTDQGRTEVVRPNRQTDTTRVNFTTGADRFTPNWDQYAGSQQGMHRVRAREAEGQVKVPPGGKGAKR